MTIEQIPLNDLQPSRANPRKAFDPAALEGLAASIGTDGLLQNLVVTPVKGAGGRYRIISGERRYRALKLLQERGVLSGDFTVPAEIRKSMSKDEGLRLATVENLQRQDLTPLEEAAALTKLVRKGDRLNDVAAQTGLSVTTIRRRLALNDLCDEAKAALAEGELSLAQAEALTLGSHEAQFNLLDVIRRGHETIGADDIRYHFLDERPSVADAIFPVEQYTGTITTDLFAAEQESYFDDADQFLALQQQAVSELAAHYKGGGAAWVEITDSYRIPDWQYDEAEDGAPGGVLINLALSGKVEIREGLARREIPDDTAAVLSGSPIAPKKPKASYSAPLCRYIAHHKTAAVAEVLLADPRKAREVAVVHLLKGFTPHDAIRTLSREAEPQTAYTVLEAQVRLYAEKLGFEIEDGESVWSSFPPFATGAVDLYCAVKSLSDHDLEGLHTLLTALAFGQVVCDRLDTGESLFNTVAQDLGVDMKSHWRPDRAFLERRNKDQLLIIAEDCGCATRYGIGLLRSYKKSELVGCLLRHFDLAQTNGEDGEEWQKARDWLPEAMQFPAISPDAEAGDDDTDADEPDDAMTDDGEEPMEEAA